MREQDPEDIVGDGIIGIGEFDRETKWFSASLQYGDCLGMRIAIDNKTITAFPIRSMNEGHCLCGRG
jgi:hypothetical protein